MNRVLMYCNKQNELANKIAEMTTNYLHSININFINDNEINIEEIQNITSEIDAIITFGGDGTILSAARKYVDTDIPIMGFNVGKLGFLSEFSANYIKENIDNLLNKNYKIIKRFLLTAKLNAEQYLAINDFVIRNAEQSKLITLSAFANEQYIGDYRADGLIISTPTGSTAYSMACGGPIIYPDANVYCITPISPHTFTLRPLIIPTNKTTKIKLTTNSKNNASIIADGNYAGQMLHSEELEIGIYTKEAQFIVPLGSNYFDVLRNKLLWAENIVKE